jgi:hypothetical protein
MLNNPFAPSSTVQRGAFAQGPLVNPNVDAAGDDAVSHEKCGALPVARDGWALRTEAMHQIREPLHRVGAFLHRSLGIQVDAASIRGQPRSPAR